MQSPFVKASCGCVVIPLDRPSDKIADMADCILLKACDGDGDWCFHTRSFEPWKVKFDTGHKYHECTPHPRPLTEEETMLVVTAIGALVCMGYNASELCSSLDAIARWRKGIPTFDT